MILIGVSIQEKLFFVESPKRPKPSQSEKFILKKIGILQVIYLR